jgi:hypothetical protein
VVLAVALFAAALAGCLDTRPQYKDPPAADNPATLVGRDGTYINEIDGSKIRSAEVTNAAGGNTVPISPGERRVKAYTLANGARAPGLWQFRFRFEAGHTYELSPSSDATLSLQVRDTATGQVVNVN